MPNDTATEQCEVITDQGRGPRCEGAARHLVRGRGLRNGAISICDDCVGYYRDRLSTRAVTSIEPLGLVEPAYIDGVDRLIADVASVRVYERGAVDEEPWISVVMLGRRGGYKGRLALDSAAAREFAGALSAAADRLTLAS